MQAQTYKIIEIVGTSNTSIEEAINNAISRSAETLNNLDWFEVVQTRGYIDQGKVKQYQVIVKLGFRLN